MNSELLFLPATVVGSEAWMDLERKENDIGPDALLSEILEKRLWSNVEMTWVMKRMVYFYGRKDGMLKKVPVERLLMNMNDILRCFYLLLDAQDPQIDDNMRSYLSTKLADATWGISERTREYLVKF